MTGGILAGVASATATALFALLQKGLIRGGIGGAVGAGIAFTLCLLLSLAGFVVTGRLEELRAAWREDRRSLALIGIISSIANLTGPIGMQFASAGTWGVLSRLDIAFSLAIGWLFLGERPGRWSGAGMVLMLGGTLAMTQTGVFAGQSREWIGILLFVTGALAVAINAYVIKGVMHRMREDVVSVANLLCISIASFALAAVLGQGEGWRLLARWPGGITASLLSGAILVPGFILYYRSLRLLPLWLTRLVQITFPVAVLIGGWALYGERPGARQWIGIMAVLIGFICVIRGLAADRPAKGYADVSLR